jgi:hypothetical protein
MNSKKIAVAVALVVGFSGPAAYAAAQDWLLNPQKITPGVLNPNVTQANIATTVCKSGWTATIRPTVAYTNKLKATQLAGDYKYLEKDYGTEMSKYEEDHLISLQLGGNPSDPKNLWPQPYAGSNARKKDVVETALKRLVCAGTLKLADAQHMIATDWAAAYKKYVTKADASVVNTEDN